MARLPLAFRTRAVSRGHRKRCSRACEAEDDSGVTSVSPRLRRPVVPARDTRTAGAWLAAVLSVSLLHGVAHAGPATATATASSSQSHVRPLTASLRRTLDAGLAQSESMRWLVERLGVSDVVVYITDEPFESRRWIGYLSFPSAVGGVPYVQVHVPSHRTSIELISALGHELQHAVEIAEAPAVVDSRSMAQHYRHVGYAVTVERSGKRFESLEAIGAGQRVRRDVHSWRWEMPREHRRGESVVLE